MKKLFLTVILFSASLLLFTTTPPPVHAASGDAVDYHDLFYEKHIVEIEVMSDDTFNMFGPTGLDGAFSKLKALYDDGLLSNGLIASNVDVYYNDILVTDNVYFKFILTGAKSIQIHFVDEGMPNDYIQIGENNSQNSKHSILGSYSFPIGTKIRVEVKDYLPWSQAYDYGRVRHGVDSTVRLILDDDVVKPVNNTTNDFFNVNLLEQNDEIVIQS